MNKVWNMVQKIKGKNNKTNVHYLKDGHDTLTSEQDISNKLGQTFPKNSSTQNYHSEFKKSKKQKEQTKLNFKSKKLEEYNPFSLDELRKSLDKAHDTACGPNDIHFQLLKHLPESALQTLLELMNDIWETGDLPSIWKLANVIHIPKPGKDHLRNYWPLG
jgi:potassium voltage-gated channel Eag-related subfamily H protein 8